MNEHDLSAEETILRTVKRVLTEVIKDTATQPGLKHPLSESTINGLRDCLILITNRQHELAEAAGRSWNDRPHYKDEPRPQGDVVVPLHRIGRPGKAPE